MDYQDYILKNNNSELYFWFAARLNLIDNLLKKNLLPKTENRLILDLGCGTGTELDILAKYGQITALDNNQAALRLAQQKKYQTILADIEKINLPEENFDVICCFDLLEHLADDEKVLNNIFQSLKNNGQLFFTVPAFSWLFSTHDLALNHRRRYNKEKIIIKLTNAGFSNISLGFWNSILFPLEASIRLMKKLLLLKLIENNSFQSEAMLTSPILNNILFSILNFENILINRGIKFPFGLTIYGIARKNAS